MATEQIDPKTAESAKTPAPTAVQAEQLIFALESAGAPPQLIAQLRTAIEQERRAKAALDALGGSRPPPAPPVAPPSAAGDNGGMEARISRLEGFAQDTRERLARIETRLENFEKDAHRSFATKEDLAKTEGALRAEIHKAISDQTWKIIGWCGSIGTILVAVVFFIARNVQP